MGRCAWNLFDVVGDHHHSGCEVICGQGVDAPQQVLPAAQIQTGCGFVEEQQLRIAHQCSCDEAPLALPLAERPEAVIGQAGETPDVPSRSSARSSSADS
jgi:hypothetical protein